MESWQTAYADVDLTYGGTFVKDMGHYAEVLEVTDLDGATGTTDMVLVETGDVSIEYAGNFREQRARFMSAMSSLGDPKITGMDRQSARVMAYAALWTYGYRDIERSHVLATSRDYSAHGESWEPEARVNGEHGLRRWLRRTYDLDVVEGK